MDAISTPTGTKRAAIAANNSAIADETEQITVPRTNFSETAFFYPQRTCDNSGNLSFEFTLPESLTRWKFRAFAHSKSLKFGKFSTEITAQKELMVEANAPRFFRSGDTLFFWAKVSNLTDSPMTGHCSLKFKSQQQSLSESMIIGKKRFGFTVNASANERISWKVVIPKNASVLNYEVIAETDKHSDGESKTIAVLPNRELITESLSLPLRGYGQKQFSFKKLIESNNSSSLDHHRLTFEYTSNPSWYALQALPYLMEFPHECSEQIFSRYYANAIGSYIMQSNASIKEVLDSWKLNNAPSLQSNLQRNQHLKSVLIEESPWVVQANSEKESKARLAQFLDENSLANNLQQLLLKLKNMQYDNGAWPWFPGMKENRYVTQHIVSGLAHLKQLGVQHGNGTQDLALLATNAIRFLDQKIQEDFDRLRRQNFDIKRNYLRAIHIHYLYARSYYNVPLNESTKAAHQFFLRQSKEHWLKQNQYLQGMIALALNRTGDKTIASQIAKSLKEHALYSDEMGMYWKKQSGYGWQNSSIEKQALMIEVFHEIEKDNKSVEEMKIWLLKQKQVQNWKSTKATTEAVYALLLRGKSLLDERHEMDIKLGDVQWSPSMDENVMAEAGSGYVQKSWHSGEIKSDMGKMVITKSADQAQDSNSISWGAIHWQYFEELDKLTKHESGLSINRQFYVRRVEKGQSQFVPLRSNETIHLGDELLVRLKLTVDRDMEFVHLKDSRASGFEPIDVQSGHKYKLNLGYYQSIKDASMNFYVDYLPKGNHIIEYRLRANISGGFSNSYAKIQSMYAPEFNAHSKGQRVRIEP